jgi:hypothetical protein
MEETPVFEGMFCDFDGFSNMFKSNSLKNKFLRKARKEVDALEGWGQDKILRLP